MIFTHLRTTGIAKSPKFPQFPSINKIHPIKPEIGIRHYLLSLVTQKPYLCALINNHLLMIRSHPAWVRGLKLSCLLLDDSSDSRTPRGCVD